jgi:hypothetical protein
VDDHKVIIDCRPTADELSRIQAIAAATGAPLEQGAELWSFACRSGRERNAVAMRLAEDLKGRAMLDPDGKVRIDLGRERSVLLRVERGGDRRAREERGSNGPAPAAARRGSGPAPAREREPEREPDLFTR